MITTLDHVAVEDFRLFVAQRLGLNFEDSKQDFLEDVLRQRMESVKVPSYSSYQHLLYSSGKEARTLAEQLTVCETYFFRYADHFRAFSEVVIPARVSARADRKELRILSAGCASGEEAYSLAILIREKFPELARWNIRIQGIDVNPQMPAKASGAKYTTWSLRDTPPECALKYFHAEGRDLVLDGSIRGMATFEERNLIDDDPAFWQNDVFDAVFCRNVIMYFTAEAARSAIARIARSLTPGGFLFLGHAETLRGISQEFHLRHTHDAFYYQRRDAEDKQGDANGSYAGTTSSPLPPQPPTQLAPDESWFDVIRRASERISSLTNGASKDALLGPQEPSKFVSTPAAWDRNLAIELLRKEKFAEAIEVVHALPVGLKADPDVQLLLAVLLTNRGEVREAERVCVGLLELDELNAGAHYLMALCREHTGDRTTAVEHDLAAIYLDALFAMPHLHIGLVTKRSGDMETARKEFEIALALLAKEDASRILLLGGGFTREALSEFCRAELRACGGHP